MPKEAFQIGWKIDHVFYLIGDNDSRFPVNGFLKGKDYQDLLKDLKAGQRAQKELERLYTEQGCEFPPVVEESETEDPSDWVSDKEVPNASD